MALEGVSLIRAESDYEIDSLLRAAISYDSDSKYILPDSIAERRELIQSALDFGRDSRTQNGHLAAYYDSDIGVIRFNPRATELFDHAIRGTAMPEFSVSDTAAFASKISRHEVAHARPRLENGWWEEASAEVRTQLPGKAVRARAEMGLTNAKESNWVRTAGYPDEVKTLRILLNGAGLNTRLATNTQRIDQFIHGSNTSLPLYVRLGNELADVYELQRGARSALISELRDLPPSPSAARSLVRRLKYARSAS